MRRQPLEQHRGGLLKTDRVRQRHGPVRRGERMRGVRAGREDKGDAVADLDVRHVRTDGPDDAGAFQAERQGEVALVKSAAQLRVEQIDAGGLDLDQNLARSGRGQRQVLEPHRFRAAVVVNADRSHCCGPESFNVSGRTV